MFPCLLLSVFLLLGAGRGVLAGEIRHSESNYRNGEYNIEIAVLIEGDMETVYGITTDYNQMSRLNRIIRESELIGREYRNGIEVVRRKLVTRTCILVFCFNATLVEDTWEPEYGVIKTVFVPEESDFEYGESEWQMVRIDETHTLINYHSRFKPDFWIPPLIGPLVVRQKMLTAARETIHRIENIAAIEPVRP